MDENRLKPPDPIFWCLPLTIVAKARNTIFLPPYWGSAIRGSFGAALMTTSCLLKHGRCDVCPSRNICLFTYLFETPHYEGNGPEARRFATAPHPYVLDIEFNEKNGEFVIERGELFSFSMKLIGESTFYLPHISSSFQVMGDVGLGRGRGKFDVVEVRSGDETVFNGKEFSWPSAYMTWQKIELFSLDAQRVTRLKLVFHTPLRLVFKGKFCNVPEFHVLIGNLVQRLISLCRFHCGSDGPEGISKDLVFIARDVKLVSNSTRWFDWERYSHRQREFMKLGGVIGEAVYEGDITPFFRLLLVGSWIHAGKGTTFGLGSYRIETEI